MEPAWVGPTLAISVAVIAFVALSVNVVLLITSRATLRRLNELGDILTPVSKDVAGITSKVRHEVDEFVALSVSLRKRAEGTAELVEDRLVDLDTLLGVVYDEVETTALDLAAGLRTLRRGPSLIKKVRRELRRR